MVCRPRNPVHNQLRQSCEIRDSFEVSQSILSVTFEPKKKSDVRDVNLVRSIEFSKQTDCLPLGISKVFVNLISLNAPSLQILLIQRETFKGLKQLKLLDLYENQIKEIESGTFSDLPSLSVINLQHNKLTRIVAESFKNLLNLDTLYLDHNEITAVDLQSFPNNSKLSVTLGGNPICKLKKHCTGDNFKVNFDTSTAQPSDNPSKSDESNEYPFYARCLLAFLIIAIGCFFCLVGLFVTYFLNS